MNPTGKKLMRVALLAPLLSAAPIAHADGGQMPPTGVDASELIRTAVAAAEAELAERARAAAERSALESEVAALRPGDHLWRPERAGAGAVTVVISLDRQLAYVYRGATLIGASTVSTGRSGHRTPTGTFEILEKRRRHFSNLYNNAPMPNMQRLTWDGIALHAGALPGYPASHGCVRLPLEFSQLLFAATRVGGRVHIIAAGPPSAGEALRFAEAGGGVTLASR